MKRVILFLIGLILFGTLAYFAGYSVYTLENPKLEKSETVKHQKSVVASEKTVGTEVNEYYYLIIEQDMLVIYKMPTEIIYDSVTLSSLHFSAKEKKHLMNGIVLQNLTEVYGFLENYMS